MIFAGLMAGMKAGLSYPSWPDMNDEFIPAVLLNSENWNWGNMINYLGDPFAHAFIQFSHRILAYILLVITIYMFYKLKSNLNKKSKLWLNSSLFLVVIQLVLGVLTVINVQGKIPLFFGVSHQLFGLLFFISLLFLFYSIRATRN